MRTLSRKQHSFFLVLVFLSAFTTPYLYPSPSEITDIVIVSTSSLPQATYWQSVLDKRIEPSKKYIVIYEDWPGGADNGLGSLYAYLMANHEAKIKYDLDLKELLLAGGSVSVFHCAGMGKRLYPLSGSECNNKSAIKVPSASGTQPILELIIDQTLLQMASLKGRLAIFWGDQIFLSTIPLRTPKAHAEIFAKVSAFPTSEEWTTKNLHQYGLILIEKRQPQLVEKTTYPNLLALVGQGKPKIGVSLGSFSLSVELLEELLEAFKQELTAKKGKFNTDYHFWMPLTWSRDAYCQFMIANGHSEEEVLNVYGRMEKIKWRLQNRSSKALFGVQNIGEDANWWDFGSLKTYYANLMSLLDPDSQSGKRLAGILGVGKYYRPESRSMVIGCSIDEADVTSSILVNVSGSQVSAHKSIIINAQCDSLIAQEAIAYNIFDNGALQLEPGEIRADLFFEREPIHVPMYSFITWDNKQSWHVILPKNSYSFGDIYNLNENYR